VYIQLNDETQDDMYKVEKILNEQQINSKTHYLIK
jgi:hypothetical protein